MCSLNSSLIAIILFVFPLALHAERETEAITVMKSLESLINDELNKEIETASSNANSNDLIDKLPNKDVIKIERFIFHKLSSYLSFSDKYLALEMKDRLKSLSGNECTGIFLGAAFAEDSMKWPGLDIGETYFQDENEMLIAEETLNLLGISFAKDKAMKSYLRVFPSYLFSLDPGKNPSKFSDKEKKCILLARARSILLEIESDCYNFGLIIKLRSDNSDFDSSVRFIDESLQNSTSSHIPLAVEAFSLARAEYLSTALFLAKSGIPKEIYEGDTKGEYFKKQSTEIKEEYSKFLEKESLGFKSLVRAFEDLVKSSITPEVKKYSQEKLSLLRKNKKVTWIATNFANFGDCC